MLSSATLPFPSLVGVDKLIDAMTTARVIVLGGPLRTGKTMFATLFAYELLKRRLSGYAVGNYPCSFFSPPAADGRNTVFLLDEAGTLFDKRTSFMNKRLNDLSLDVLSFLGKRNNYLLLASHATVDKRFERGVYCERVLTFKYAWYYTWSYKLSSRRTQKGRFVLLYPQAWFDTYDTYFEPPRDLSEHLLGCSVAEADEI